MPSLQFINGLLLWAVVVGAIVWQAMRDRPTCQCPPPIAGVPMAPVSASGPATSATPKEMLEWIRREEQRDAVRQKILDDLRRRNRELGVPAPAGAGEAAK
jgi:hypothetical protein